MKLYNLDEKKAADRIKKTDRERRIYYESRTGREWGSIEANSMMFNVSLLGLTVQWMRWKQFTGNGNRGISEWNLRFQRLQQRSRTGQRFRLRRRMLTGSFSAFSICLTMTINEMSRIPSTMEGSEKFRRMPD